MIKINIFDPEYIEFLCPYWHETVWDIIGSVKDKDSTLKKNEIKVVVLNILFQLLENKLIFIINNFNDDKIPIKLNLSPQDSINYVDNIWKESFDYPEYYSLNFYGFEKWYVNPLIKLGLEHTTNWQNFVHNNIGDIEKWIKENKPK